MFKCILVVVEVLAMVSKLEDTIVNFLWYL